LEVPTGRIHMSPQMVAKTLIYQRSMFCEAGRSTAHTDGICGQQRGA
jgi:hypothetical protein